jgi:hypothetical protein
MSLCETMVPNNNAWTSASSEIFRPQMPKGHRKLRHDSAKVDVAQRRSARPWRTARRLQRGVRGPYARNADERSHRTLIGCRGAHNFSWPRGRKEIRAWRRGQLGFIFRLPAVVSEQSGMNEQSGMRICSGLFR